MRKTKQSSKDNSAPLRAMLAITVGRLKAAQEARNRVETSVIVATLALDGQGTDYDWRIAAALRGQAWDGLSAIDATLSEALELLQQELQEVSHG